MSTDQKSAENALRAPQQGDLVRYSLGATALMIMETDHGDGTWSGPQCMGGQVKVALTAMSLTTFRDRHAWVRYATFRKQTPEEAMTQIDYVLGESDTLSKETKQLDPAAKEYYSQDLQPPEDRVYRQGDTIKGQKFFDTPEAKRLHDTPPEMVSISLNDMRHYHRIFAGWFVVDGISAAIIGAIVGALVAKLL